MAAAGGAGAETMKAIAADVSGEVDVLHEVEVPVPMPGPHDLLVRVKAIALNPVDAKVRRGFGAPAGTAMKMAPRIMGYDASGVVVGKGSEVTLFNVGDEVMYAGAIHRQGTNAPFHVVDERIVGRKPRNLSHAETAAVPLVALTAWEGMVEGMGIPIPETLGRAAKEKTILVVAGAGGVGSIAIQIAKRVLGLRVVATASRPETKAFCERLGADVVINHRNKYKDELTAAGLAGVDYVMNCVDLDSNYDELVSVLNPLGKICAISSGSRISSVNIGALMPLRATLVWELMFIRPQGIEMELQHGILTRVADLLEEGVLVSTMTSSKPYSLESLRAAHVDQESGTIMGKQVLVLED